MNTKRTSASNCAETVPPRYELIDKDGSVVATNVSAQHLGIVARQMWPDQEQDEDRTGNGWDVSVVGADR